MLTSLGDTLEKLAMPAITVRADITNITSDRIIMDARIDVTNPDSFNLSVGTITMVATTETGKSEGNFTIGGAGIPAGQTVTLHGQGALLFDAFNANYVLLTLHTEVSADIAGYTKTLPLDSTINVTIPPLEDYFTKDKPIDLALLVDFRLKPTVLHGDVTVSMNNPTVMPINAHDIHIDYFRIDNGVKTFLRRTNITGGPFPPHAMTNYTGTLDLPYKLLIKPLVYKHFLPDALYALLRVNFTVFGVNTMFWVGIGSDIDLRFFK